MYLPQGSDHVVVSGLMLDGTNSETLPSPTVNSADVTFEGDDITNHHTGICFTLGASPTEAATDIRIRWNRIHGCGRLPPTNHDHGVYDEYSSSVLIAWNLIYDNADRGVQLYPSAQHTTIVNNVIDGNGEGVIVSGSSGLASSDNLVANNVISNAAMRYDVESWYPPGNPLGTNNVIRDNCLWGGAKGTVDESGGGFLVLRNTVADPRFADRARGDFRMRPAGRCLRVAGDVAGAVTAHLGRSVAEASPSPAPATPTGSAGPTPPASPSARPTVGSPGLPTAPSASVAPSVTPTSPHAAAPSLRRAPRSGYFLVVALSLLLLLSAGLGLRYLARHNQRGGDSDGT
jgi:hypothetical protein